MSPTRKTIPTETTYTMTADSMTAQLPTGDVITLSTELDIEEMFNIVSAVTTINDEADAIETMVALRVIMPDDFLRQAKGIDAVLTLPVFLEWVQAMSSRLGKAFTSSYTAPILASS